MKQSIITMMLAISVIMMSCQREKSIEPVSQVDIEDYHRIVSEMVSSAYKLKSSPGQLNRPGKVDSTIYFKFAQETITLFQSYMKKNHLTQKQAAQQWETAMRGCGSCWYLIDAPIGQGTGQGAIDPCTLRAYSKFAAKQSVCLAITLVPVPVVAWVGSLSCLVSAGMELTADLEDCKAAAIKKAQSGQAPK